MVGRFKTKKKQQKTKKRKGKGPQQTVTNVFIIISFLKMMIPFRFSKSVLFFLRAQPSLQITDVL